MSSIGREIDEDFAEERFELRPAAAGAALVLTALTLAILYNALFGQTPPAPTAAMAPGGAVTKMSVDAGEAQGAVVSLRFDPVVEAVQKELTSAGYYDGPIDGVNGKRTRLALESWQRANAMDVTGIPTEEIADHLAFNRTIAEAAGATSSLDTPPADSRVARVQTGLAELGYLPGAADGTLSEQTRDAIRQFERDRGLAETGEVTEALLEEMAKTSGQSSIAAD